MDVSLDYTAYPHDFHLTGTADLSFASHDGVETRSGVETVDIAFDPAAALPPHQPPVNLIYELELKLHDEDAYVLLDAERPFEFKFAPSAE